MTERTVTTDQAEPPLERLSVGRGPARVAFIHGFLSSHAIWRTSDFAPVFDSAGAVAAPLPGHHPWSMPAPALAPLLEGDRLIDGYARALRRASEGAPIDLVGHSSGALIALELARLHPGLVGRVFILGALGAGRRDGRMNIWARIASAPLLGRPAFRAMIGWWLSSRNRFDLGVRSVFGPGGAEGPAPARMREDLLRCDPEALRIFGLWLARRDIFAKARAIQIPVCAIVCSEDPVVPASHQLRLAKALPQAHAMVLRTGHLPMIERPDAYAAALYGWLTRSTPPSDAAGRAAPPRSRAAGDLLPTRSAAAPT